MSTSGTSPALAAWLRTRLAPLVGPEVSTLAWLLAQCRRALQAAGRGTEGADWSPLLDEGLLASIREDDVATVEARLNAWAEAAR